MFRFIENIRTARAMDLFREAQRFLRENYRPPVRPKKPESTAPKDGKEGSGWKDSGIRFSLEPSNDSTPNLGRKYSAESEEDYYDDERNSFEAAFDTRAVDSAMKDEITERTVSALDALLERMIGQTFVEKVIDIIRRKGIRDSAVYKAAQIDRRLFSKIMSDNNYKPSKDTAVAISLALQLPLAEANDLLGRAGYTLSHSNKRDVVIEYFFRERIYNLTKINTVLHMLRLRPIGRI